MMRLCLHRCVARVKRDNASTSGPYEAAQLAVSKAWFKDATDDIKHKRNVDHNLKVHHLRLSPSACTYRTCELRSAWRKNRR